MGGVVSRLKIETRKLYWLHARYGTFKVHRKYARRTLRHERRLFKYTPHFLRRFSNGTETFFWPLLYICVYVSVCMYICVYVSVCMYICVYVSVCMYICVYVSVCMYICVYVSVCMYICVYVHMCVCTYVCM